MKKKALLLVVTAGLLAGITTGITGCSGNRGGNNPDPSQDVVYCSFTAKGGEGYSISVTDPAITLTNGTATVESGTMVTFVVTLEDGYRESVPLVKANGETLSKNNDGTYSTIVSSDTTITVEGVYHYYSVTFTGGEGYSFTDVSVTLDGNGSAKVKNGDTVTFKVAIGDEYDGTEAMVKVGTHVLSAGSDGTYSLTVSSDTVVEVAGVTKKVAKYAVTFQSGTGFSYTNVSEVLTDGSAEVAEGTTVSFTITASEGYNLDSAVVKANDDIVTFNTEIERYCVTVSEATIITVEGVAENKYVVSMPDGKGYSFTDVTGITLADGSGEAKINDVISFKLSIDSAYEKGSYFRVLAGENELTPEDDVYSFTVQADVSVTVKGLEKKEEIIIDKLISGEDGTASDDVYSDRGYTKSTVYAGGYRMVSLNDVYLGSYSEFRFAVKGSDTSGWFEFFYGDPTLIGDCTAEWEEFIFVKEEVENDDDVETGFRLYQGEVSTKGWRDIFIPEELYLSEITCRLGFCSSYAISELIGREDMNYVAPEKTITFTESANPAHTITVNGEAVTSATARLGGEFTFKVIPDDGVTCTVSLNGKMISGDADNNYTITVGRSNVVAITDSKLLSEKVLDAASYDSASGTSSLTSSWHQINAFASVTGISAYSSVYFSATFSAGGWLGFGQSDTVFEVTKDMMAGTQYNFILTKGTGANDYVMTCKENSETWNLTITENLSEIGFSYQDNFGASCTATFSPLYGEIA